MMLIENRRFLAAIVCAAMEIMVPVTARAATTFTVNPAIDRTDGIAKGMALWCDRATSATKGRIQCAAAGTHVRPEDAAAALKNGKVDLICIPHKTDLLRYRISRIGDLPVLGDFAETTSVAYQRIYDTTPLMANEHKGYKVLAVFTQPPAFLFTSQSQAAGPAMPKRGSNAKGPAPSATPKEQSNGENSRYLTGTTTEFLAFPGHESMHTAFMFKGGRANVSYVFVLNQDKWDRLSEQDKAALNRISGVEAAGLMGRTLDAQEWKANIGVRNAGVSFYSPSRAAQAPTQKDFAIEEKVWVAQAKSAGIKNPASLLVTFRSGISHQEDAE